MKKLVLLIILIIGIPLAFFAQEKESIVFKKSGGFELKMDIYYPPGYSKGKKYPAIVFFFGGGWRSGGLGQFEPHALHFAKLGMVCFIPEYRVSSRHNTSPIDALTDTKSAIRFIRANAKVFSIDEGKIVAAGGSAGGHLAAAAALTEKFNDEADDLTISSKPSTLVLFNPVIDNGPGGYGFERIGELYKDFSPLHNITEGAPPTLIMVGTKDNLIPVETVSYYKKVMEKVGSRCDLVLYEGEEHGFFNFNRNPNKYPETLREMEAFLVSLKLLK